MRATYLLYYEFKVKSSVFVWRTRWRLCLVNGRLREARGPGVPGPYGLLFTVQKFSKNNLANARIICYDNKLKTCSVPKGHGHIEQRESF